MCQRFFSIIYVQNTITGYTFCLTTLYTLLLYDGEAPARRKADPEAAAAKVASVAANLARQTWAAKENREIKTKRAATAKSS